MPKRLLLRFDIISKNTSSESKAKLSGDVFCKDLFVLALDGGLAVWPERDYTDRNSEVAFHELDIVLEFLRKLTFLADFRKVFLPAGELGVNRLYLGCDVERNLICLNAVHLVGCADLDGLEIVQAVGFHHDEVGDSVNHHGVLQRHEVQPTAAARTACDGSELVSDLTEFLSGLIEKFCRERTAAHACAVGLEYSIDMPDL